MLARAGAVWFGIMLMAILNGAFRDVVLTPRLGDLGARAVSCLTLASVDCARDVDFAPVDPAGLDDRRVADWVDVARDDADIRVRRRPLSIWHAMDERCWPTTTCSRGASGFSCWLRR